MARFAVTIAHLQGERETYLMPERARPRDVVRWAAEERQPGDTVYIITLIVLERLP